jgi:hypothetical protein
MLEKVILRKDARVASIILNRPDVGNAVDPELMAQLRDSLGYDREGLRAAKEFFRDTAECMTHEAVRYGVARLANFLSSRQRN